MYILGSWTFPQKARHDLDADMKQGSLTRVELATSLRDAHGGLSLSESQELVDAILDAIQEGLLSDGQVKIRGFGTFEVRRRKARVSKHPRTGASVEIPELDTIRFRPSDEFFSR